MRRMIPQKEIKYVQDLEQIIDSYVVPKPNPNEYSNIQFGDTEVSVELADDIYSVTCTSYAIGMDPDHWTGEDLQFGDPHPALRPFIVWYIDISPEVLPEDIDSAEKLQAWILAGNLTKDVVSDQYLDEYYINYGNVEDGKLGYIDDLEMDDINYSTLTFNAINCELQYTEENSLNINANTQLIGNISATGGAQFGDDVHIGAGGDLYVNSIKPQTNNMDLNIAQSINLVNGKFIKGLRLPMWVKTETFTVDNNSLTYTANTTFGTGQIGQFKINVNVPDWQTGIVYQCLFTEQPMWHQYLSLVIPFIYTDDRDVGRLIVTGQLIGNDKYCKVYIDAYDKNGNPLTLSDNFSNRDVLWIKPEIINH